MHGGGNIGKGGGGQGEEELVRMIEKTGDWPDVNCLSFDLQTAGAISENGTILGQNQRPRVNSWHDIHVTSGSLG